MHRNFGLRLMSIGLAVLLLVSTLPAQQAAQQTAPAAAPPAAPAAAPEALVRTPGPGAPAPAAEAKPATPDVSELVIGGGDLLVISVYGAPDFDKIEARVASNGEVTLPFIGATPVSGLSVSQARDLIAKRLAAGEYFNQPQVSVHIREYATQGVSVLGEVNKPGVYPVMGPRKLYDLISEAGGLTPKAGDQVSVTRRTSSSPITVKLSNDPVKNAAANIDIKPGDTVTASKAGIVYVVGDVSKPGGFIMENGAMTVLQAIAMAQGTNSTAALSKARVIRKTPSGRAETPIDLKQVLASKVPDPQLQSEDILFVPGSAAKSATKRGLEAILQTATGLAIYRP